MTNTNLNCLVVLFLALLVANPSHSQNVGATFNSADGKMIYTVTEVGTTNSVSVKKKGTPTGKIIIPDTVTYLSTNFLITSLENSAFSNCPGIDTVSIGQNIIKMGNGAFIGNPNIKQFNFFARECVDLNSNYYTFSTTISSPCNVNIGPQVKRIPGYLFSSFRNLKSLAFLGNSACTAIGDYAFYNCDNAALTNLVLPDSIQSIGQYAFSNCYGIESLTIGTNLTNLGKNSFFNLNGLSCVRFNATNCSDLTTTGISSNVDTFSVQIGKKVTRIPGYLFYGCAKIDSVLFEDSTCCSEIGTNAFCNATGLTYIRFPKSLKTVQPIAFGQCTGLKTISIPASLTNIKNGAFSVCQGPFEVDADNPNYASLNGVLYSRDFSALLQCPTTKEGLFDVPSTVKSIGSFAFAYCSALTSITMPDEVTSIGEVAFYACSGIKSFVFPRSVTTIEPQAFQRCIGLSSIMLPVGIVAIGNSAFENCTGLDSIQLPNTVKSIGTHCFSRCTKLQRLIVPCSIDTIGSSAFSNCSNLTTIVMQDTVPPHIVGYTPFSYIASRPKLYVPVGTKKAYLPLYGADFDSGKNIVEAAGFISNNDVNYAVTDPINKYLTVIQNTNAYAGNIAIPLEVMYQSVPYTVKAIGNDAFNSCANLITISIPNTVRTIGNSAFIGCSKLSTIDFPDSMETIGSNAFQNCTSLATAKFGRLVYSIDDYAFQGCTALTSVELPDRFEKLGLYGFQGCTNLNKLYLGKAMKTIKTYSFQGCTNLKSVTVPDSTSSIESYAFSDDVNLMSLGMNKNLSNIETLAFQNCSKLDSLTLPESITTVGDHAFINCTGLKTLYYNAANCTSVGSGNAMTSNNCFKNCTSLTTVNIGENVNRLPTYLFYRCTGLTTVNGGNHVREIGDLAFYNCSKLNLTKLPDSLITLGKRVFSYCTSITSLSLGKNIASIGLNAFSSCTSLVTVNYHPTRCTVMGDFSYPAFGNCTSFTTLLIDENVTFLPNYAFNSSSKLSNIYLMASTPPTLGSTSVFTNIPTNAKLYVPIGSKPNYLSYNNSFTYTSIFSSVGSTTDGARIIEQAMGLDDLKQPDIKVFTTSNRQLNISCPNESGGYVWVYNTAGQLQTSCAFTGTTVTLAKQLLPDLYLIVIQADGKKKMTKVMMN